MSKFTVTAINAAGEIARRKHNAPHKGAKFTPWLDEYAGGDFTHAPEGVRVAAEHQVLSRMTGPDLADAVELLSAKPKRTRKAPKAQAPKPARVLRLTKDEAGVVRSALVVNPHTELRRLAWQDHVASKQAARKAGDPSLRISYADACAARGTFPAKQAANA